MTRLIVTLTLVVMFLLIFWITYTVGKEPPLGEGWYLVGPQA